MTSTSSGSAGSSNAQGGVLEIGKDDRGEVVGVREVLRLLEEIPNKVQSLLGIVVDVNLKSESGREYLEIVVEPHTNPISYKGQFHYRSGSTKQLLSGAALNRFLLDRYGRTWDDVPWPGVRLSDLDDRAIDRFRRRAVESERLAPEVLDEPVDSLIENLSLREGAYLKRAAVLLFHPSPQQFMPDAYVKIGYFRGSELLYQDVVEGDLFAQVDRTMDLLYSKYSRALISYDGIYRVETFPGASRGHEGSGDQRHHPPGLRQPHDDSDSRVRRPDLDLERGSPGSRVGHRTACRGTVFASAQPARRLCILSGRNDRSLGARYPADSGRLPRGGQPDANLAAGVGRQWAMGEVSVFRGLPGWPMPLLGGSEQVLPGRRAAGSGSFSMQHPESTQKASRKHPEGSDTSQSLADRIVAFLRTNPSASRRELVEGLQGATEGSVKYQLGKLKRLGQVTPCRARPGRTLGGRRRFRRCGRRRERPMCR